MQTVALILPQGPVYYSGILLALAALAGTCLLLGLRALQNKPREDGALLALLSLLLSVPLARAVHWYCNSDQYASFSAAMTDFSAGGFSSLGAGAAVLLSALLLRAVGKVKNLPALLDCAAPAGALTLAVGKMACLFSADCRSKFTLQGQFFYRLPFMVSSATASGGTQWRVATFALESLVCCVLCVVFSLLFTSVRSAPRFRKKWKDGNVFLLFLGVFGAFTVMLDSTRYDALYFRSNGFVSVTQIVSVAFLLLGTVIYSVRSVKARGFRWWHAALWVLWAAAAGTAGYMEYVVQRHNDRFLFAYSVMLGGFLLDFLIECVLCRTTLKKKKAPAA